MRSVFMNSIDVTDLIDQIELVESMIRIKFIPGTLTNYNNQTVSFTIFYEDVFSTTNITFDFNTPNFVEQESTFLKGTEVFFEIMNDAGHTIDAVYVDGHSIDYDIAYINTYALQNKGSIIITLPQTITDEYLARHMHTIKVVFVDDDNIMYSIEQYFMVDEIKFQQETNTIVNITNAEICLHNPVNSIISSVAIDGQVLDSNCYVISYTYQAAYILLSPEYVNTLENNDYVLQIVVNDTIVETKLIVNCCPTQTEHIFYEPGLWNGNGTEMLVSWDDLVNLYGFKPSTDCLAIAGGDKLLSGSLAYIIKTYTELGLSFDDEYILSIATATELGDYAFSSVKLNAIVLPSDILSTGKNDAIPLVFYNNTVSSWSKVTSTWKTIHCIDGDVYPSANNNFEWPDPGIYTVDGIPVVLWNDLVNTYGLDLTATYTNANYLTTTTSLHYILINNDFGFDLSDGFILSVGTDVTKIGAYALFKMDSTTNSSYTGPTLKTLIIPNSVKSFAANSLGTTLWVETFVYNGTQEEWGKITKANQWYGASGSKFTVHCIDGDLESSGCVAADTLILLADGTYKRIDELTYDDVVMVWNFETGTYDAAPISIIFYHGHKNYDILNLQFSDGTILKVINDHGLYSVDDNNYVYLSINNVDDYIGKQFVKYNNGNIANVTLVKYYVTTEYTGSYCLQTAGTNNYIAENMFSLTKPDITGWFDYFEIGDDMKYDESQMQADIEMYGLYTYEDFVHTGITYEQFLAFNGPYLKVLVGRGVLTFEDIEQLIQNYLV
jgi:hypothetical protein